MTHLPRSQGLWGRAQTNRGGSVAVWALPSGAASLQANTTQRLALEPARHEQQMTCPVESHQGSLPEITNTLGQLASLLRLSQSPCSLGPVGTAGRTRDSQKFPRRGVLKPLLPQPCKAPHSSPQLPGHKKKSQSCRLPTGIWQLKLSCLTPLKLGGLGVGGPGQSWPLKSAGGGLRVPRKARPSPMWLPRGGTCSSSPTLETAS